MSSKKFILFDNDGVLVETEIWYFRANVKALKELGVHLDEEVYLQLMAQGRTSWEIAKAQGVTEEAIHRAREKRNNYYQHFLKTEEVMIPHIKEVVARLSKQYRMGIVTTSRRVDFEILHHKKEITRFMDFVLCEEDYARAKPFPDPYLKGLQLFNASQDEAIVVEDSQRGLSSAVAAGIDCVIVHNDFTQSHDFSNATHRIQSLRELETLLQS